MNVLLPSDVLSLVTRYIAKPKYWFQDWMFENFSDFVANYIAMLAGKPDLVNMFENKLHSLSMNPKIFDVVKSPRNFDIEGLLLNPHPKILKYIRKYNANWEEYVRTNDINIRQIIEYSNSRELMNELYRIKPGAFDGLYEMVGSSPICSDIISNLPEHIKTKMSKSILANPSDDVLDVYLTKPETLEQSVILAINPNPRAFDYVKSCPKIIELVTNPIDFDKMDEQTKELIKRLTANLGANSNPDAGLILKTIFSNLESGAEHLMHNLFDHILTYRNPSTHTVDLINMMQTLNSGRVTDMLKWGMCIASSNTNPDVLYQMFIMGVSCTFHDFIANPSAISIIKENPHIVKNRDEFFANPGIFRPMINTRLCDVLVKTLFI